MHSDLPGTQCVLTIRFVLVFFFVKMKHNGIDRFVDCLHGIHQFETCEKLECFYIGMHEGEASILCLGLDRPQTGKYMHGHIAFSRLIKEIRSDEFYIPGFSTDELDIIVSTSYTIIA